MNVLTLVLAASVALSAAAASAQLKAPPSAKPAVAPASAATRPQNQAPPVAPPVSAADAQLESAGELAAAGWLVLLDRRDWGRAWDTSSALFRSTVPIGTWMDAIPKVREPLGPFVERQTNNRGYKTQLEGRPEGAYVTVIFLSKFAARAEIQEVVTTVREGDGRWRVTGYSTR